MQSNGNLPLYLKDKLLKDSLAESEISKILKILNFYVNIGFKIRESVSQTSISHYLREPKKALNNVKINVNLVMLFKTAFQKIMCFLCPTLLTHYIYIKFANFSAVAYEKKIL